MSATVKMLDVGAAMIPAAAAATTAPTASTSYKYYGHYMRSQPAVTFHRVPVACLIANYIYDAHHKSSRRTLKTETIIGKEADSATHYNEVRYTSKVHHLTSGLARIANIPGMRSRNFCAGAVFSSSSKGLCNCQTGLGIVDRIECSVATAPKVP